MQLPSFLRALSLALALGGVIGSAGCLTIPKATMARISSFSDADYLAFDPTVIRVRITSDSDDPLRPERTRLTLRVLRRDGSAAAIQAGMVLLDEQDLKPSAYVNPLARFGFGYQPEHVYILGFDDRSIRAFRKLQSFIRKRAIDNGTITVNCDFREHQPALVNIDLLLDPKEGYFPLFEKVRFPLAESPTGNF